MKHLRSISTGRADTFADFLNAVWRAWLDYRYAKKNENGV